MTQEKMNREMRFCPSTGARDGEEFKEARFSESTYRSLWPHQVWKYNPFSGEIRSQADVKDDPYGLKIK